MKDYSRLFPQICSSERELENLSPTTHFGKPFVINLFFPFGFAVTIFAFSVEWAVIGCPIALI